MFFFLFSGPRPWFRDSDVISKQSVSAGVALNRRSGGDAGFLGLSSPNIIQIITC